MDYEVLKAFNSVNRRFAPGPGLGGTIADTDDISPFTVEERVTSKFIKPKAQVEEAPQVVPTTKAKAAADSDAK